MKKNYFLLLISIFLFTFSCSHRIFAENRIISLIPSSTELVCAIGFGTDLIAVSNYCNYPESIASLPKIGDQNLNVEKILSLKPSILIDTNSIHKRYEELLKRLNLNYINIDIKSQMDLPLAAKNLATLLGDSHRGDSFIKTWNQNISKLKIINNDKKPKIYVEIWDNPIQAAGGNNNIDSILRIAGGRNVFANQKDYPKINPEMMILGNPDIIFLAYPNADIEAVGKRPGWSRIEAVKNHNIYSINQDIIVRPSPRNLEAIKEINKTIDKVVNNERK